MSPTNTNISVEPLLNEGKADGSGVLVTTVAEVGAVSHRTAVTVNDTPQEITISANKNTIEFHNSGSNDIYVGGSGVDSDKGIPIFIDHGKVFKRVKSTFSIYVVCAAGQTSTLRILEYA